MVAKLNERLPFTKFRHVRFPQNRFLSPTRPNYLNWGNTGEAGPIIDTRFQASQLASSPPFPHLMLPFQLGCICSRCSGNEPAPLSPPNSRRCSRGGSDERSDARERRRSSLHFNISTYLLIFF